MSSELRLPVLPLGGSEATIVRWLKQPGERVAAGDALLIVVSERAEVVLPAGLAGVLTQHLVAEGASAALGAPLAAFAPADQESVPPASDQPTEPSIRATPVARRIAQAAGVDLAGLAATGVSGRVCKADVLAALALPLEAAPASPSAALSTQAPPLQPIAHYLPGAETQALTAINVDAERMGAVRQRLAPEFARRGLALTDTLLVLAATAATLPRHPLLNGAWHDDAIIVRRGIDLALLAGDRALLVPGAQDLNLRGLARAVQRETQADAAASTFAVVEHAGSVWWGQPIAFEHHPAALGVGAVRKRPVVQTSQGVERLVVHRTMILSLAYDARVLDQCSADAFLRDLKEHLEHFDTYPGV